MSNGIVPVLLEPLAVLGAAARPADAFPRDAGMTDTELLDHVKTAFVDTTTAISCVRSSRWGTSDRTFAFRLPYPPCADGRPPVAVER